MADDDYDEDRDPLLVRPFVLNDEGTVGDASPQTWPSATTREVRSHRALEGADDPTAIFEVPADPAVPVPRPRHARPARHRRLVLAGAGALVLLGAGAAGYAALAPDVRPSVSTALPVEALPPVTGPSTATAPTTTAATSAPALRPTTAAGATPSATPSSATPSASPPPSPPPSPPVVIGLPPADDRTPVAPAPPENDRAGVPETTRVGVVRGQNGLCLDLNGGVAADDNHVQVFTCNSSPAQVWTLATDGSLRVAGKCALLVGEGTVHIVGCDGRTTARWRVSGQLLINAASNGCLTDPSTGRTSGTGVRVTACTGAAGQRWSLP